ncbi:MAG: transcriptional repressor [Muribaculaceae bacterium]|nr:transcriptional repressor [Muribaculaceae bacterium]
MKAMVDTEIKEHLRKRFAEFIKSKKMRQTPERFAILDKVFEQRVHFDIDELYRDIESEYRVCRATVYNTVELLCECNILRKHYLNENQAAYELSDDRHLHLICLNCGKVREVRDECFNECFEKMKFRQFKASFISTNIYGLCSSCSRKMKKE